MESSDDVAKLLAEKISKLVHGLNVYDVERALVAVMSCGICTTSKSTTEVGDRYDFVVHLLNEQVMADYPKISAMKAKGLVNAYILPTMVQ